MLKALLTWFVPTAALVAVYVADDPMRVLRWHPDMLPHGFLPNKANITVKNYSHFLDSLHYDSFIIGSSVTINHDLDQWTSYLPEGASAFHFDFSAIAPHQIELILNHLNLRSHLANALIILDTSALGRNTYYSESDINYMTPAAIQPGILAKTKYHFKIFKFWWRYSVLSNYFAHSLGQETIGLRHELWDDEIDYIHPPTNTFRMQRLSARLDSLAMDYDRNPTPIRFSAATDSLLPPLIDSSTEATLMSIRKILDNAGTNYRIVIAPSRRNFILNPEDDIEMHNIFGENFLNLSSIHAEQLSPNPYQWEDSIHYRPAIANILMDIIYNGNKTER